MTNKNVVLTIFVLAMKNTGVDTLHIIALTHHKLAVGEMGSAHIDPDNQAERLEHVKSAMKIDELMYLSTCNRIEYTISTTDKVDSIYFDKFMRTLYPGLNDKQINQLVDAASIYQGKEAIQHSLRVASSVESMVVGEREIITQVRNAYNDCHKMGLTGDYIRILMRHTIETAKKVYTETDIARRPVSVVSLAYHRLKDMNVPLDARVLIVGAGVTNTNMSRFLKKHGYTNFHVFNRTLSKAEQLAGDLNGNAHPLSDLAEYDKGFDLIITCTGAEDHILTPQIYNNLLQGETDRKVVIDIAIPQDLSPRVVEKENVHHISVEALQQISNENLKARSKEVEHVEAILDEALEQFLNIYKERSIEIAMREVPNKVKEIKNTAINEVFKQDITSMDDQSREVLERVIGYMEKKYMSMPMLMAKDILLKKQS